MGSQIPTAQGRAARILALQQRLKLISFEKILGMTEMGQAALLTPIFFFNFDTAYGDQWPKAVTAAKSSLWDIPLATHVQVWRASPTELSCRWGHLIFF